MSSVVAQTEHAKTATYRKILVLCIDRDNDVGERLGIPTPVIGRDNVLNVAIQYILRFPDDSDANAMFAAIQLYDNLASTLGKDNVEIALVTGASSEDTMADLKLLDELSRVLRVFDADGLIVVSDSPSDEAVIPLLQSKRPVISVRRVVVRQSRRFEEFAVLAKYYLLKMLTEPKYRKYALGLPGAIFLLAGISIIISAYIPPILAPILSSGMLIALGAIVMIYALNIHQEILRFIQRYELTFFTMVISLLLVILYPLTITGILKTTPLELLTRRPTIFDVLSIAIAITALINIIEIYAKRGEIPYRRIFSAISMTLFPSLVLNSITHFVLNMISPSMLFACITSYIIILMISLMVLNRLSRRRVKDVSHTLYQSS